MADRSGGGAPRRWRALAGVIGIGLLGVGLLLPGAPVTSDEPVRHVVDMIAGDHVRLALGTYLGGLGLIALTVFAIEVSRRSDRRAGTAVAAVSVVVAAGLIVIGMALSTGLSVQPDVAARPGIVRVAVDTGNVVIELAKLPLAATIVGLLPLRALTPTTAGLRFGGMVAAAVGAATALPPLVVSAGPMQFGGPVDLGSAGLLLVWIAAVSIAMGAGVDVTSGPGGPGGAVLTGPAPPA